MGFALWLPKCLHWPFCPGVFIAILAFVAAAIVFRGEPKRREKVVWIAVFFAFMCGEIWMMSKDRVAHDKQQEETAKQEAKHFQDIAGGLSQTIQQAQENFKSEMDNLQTNLSTTRATLSNTAPRAVIEFQRVNYNVPTITVERKLNINYIRFTNSGNAVATHFLREARLYVGRPNSLEDQEKIAKDFDAWWEKTPHREGLPVEPNVPAMFPFQIDAISESDILGIQNHVLAVYLLARFVYSDGTGTWANDKCMWYEDATRDLEISYRCKIHENHRYAIKRQR